MVTTRAEKKKRQQDVSKKAMIKSNTKGYWRNKKKFPRPPTGTMILFDSRQTKASLKKSIKKKNLQCPDSSLHNDNQGNGRIHCSEKERQWKRPRVQRVQRRKKSPKEEAVLETIEDIGSISSMYLSHHCRRDKIWKAIEDNGWYHMRWPIDKRLMDPMVEEITKNVIAQDHFKWKQFKLSPGAYIHEGERVETQQLGATSNMDVPLFSSVITQWLCDSFLHHKYAKPYLLKWEEPAGKQKKTGSPLFHLDLPQHGDIKKWKKLSLDSSFPTHLFPIIVIIGLSNGAKLEVSGKYRGDGHTKLKKSVVKSLDFGHVLIMQPHVFHRSVVPSPFSHGLRTSIVLGGTEELASL